MKKGVIGGGGEQHKLDKQMGCMANFLHIFDRHHTLTGKRLPPTITHSSSQPPTPNTSLQFSPSLSLDNRTITNCPDNSEIASEKQRPSISVVARLMGLDEPITDSEAVSSPAPEPETNRDQPLPLLHHHYRFFDTNNNFRLKIKPSNASDPKQKTETNFRGKKKSCFYDSDELFPQKTKKTSVTVGGAIEKKLKRRGIDEPFNDDLHALKQILEALHLKGLLHSNNNKSTLPINQSPIVVMKPNKIRPHVSHSPQHSSSFGSSPMRVRAEPEAIRTKLQDKGMNLKQPASCVRRCPNRMRNVQVAPVKSPKVNMRVNVPEQPVTSRSKRSVTEEDESSTLSDTSLTTINSERYKKEEYYKEGRNVLERCDKLLINIAQMTTTTTELQQQPSPVSVFDSSFYKDDSPSPLIKHYKGESEDEALCYNGVVECEDSEDYVYVCEIVRACNYFPHNTNVFMLLEKQQFLKGNDTSKTCMLRRRLIFDTIQEILNKNKRLPPWKTVSLNMDKIWLEFKRMRDREDETCSEELLDVICLILRKDMAQEIMNQCPLEMGGLILDIERLVFKDLIGEIIRDLASFKEPLSVFRRKLVF